MQSLVDWPVPNESAARESLPGEFLRWAIATCASAGAVAGAGADAFATPLASRTRTGEPRRLLAQAGR